MSSSSLTSRLRDLVHGGTERQVAARADRAVSPAPGWPAQLGDVLGGETLELERGSCLVVDRVYMSDSSHGHSVIGQSADVARRCLHHLSLLAGWPAPVPASCAEGQAPSVLFFDLETTGLAGGAGTYAFLVGCGAFVDGAFHTRQFFLTGYGAERPLLAAVAAQMAAADVLVSFNGRTFDAPLLETRYLFHRVPVPFAGVPHLDMLHVARRLWSDDAGCSLRVLEHARAGLLRRGDIPGSEIPARYVHYARTGDAQSLVPVFEHNRLDLLSLAVLMTMALELVERGAEGTRTARECLGLGHIYERAGLGERAALCCTHAASGRVRGSREDRAEALRWLARRMRRERRHDEAAGAWQQILALDKADHAARRMTREAAHALAVHHEHRSRDLHAAHVYAVRAATAASTEADRVQARHRLARLERKLGLENERDGLALFEA